MMHLLLVSHHHHQHLWWCIVHVSHVASCPHIFQLFLTVHQPASIFTWVWSTFYFPTSGCPSLYMGVATYRDLAVGKGFAIQTSLVQSGIDMCKHLVQMKSGTIDDKLVQYTRRYPSSLLAHSHFQECFSPKPYVS